MKIGVLSFTDKGKQLVERLKPILQNNLQAEVLMAKEDKKLWVGEIFTQVDALIFVGASGIALRYIAPHIKSKDKDPAVIVIDELGRFVIPILSGHIGGANALGKKIADKIQATVVITTATDINNLLAIDSYAVENGYTITDISKIKDISSALLKGKEVGFCSSIINSEVPKGLIAKKTGEIGVCLSYSNRIKPFDTTLNLVAKNLVLGIGCKKNIGVEQMKNWVLSKLEELEISEKAIKAVASIDIKKEEPCIIELAKFLQVEFKIFTADQLSQVQESKASSSFVKSITGVDNVCERAALLESNGVLVIEKIAENGMTLAIAESRIK